MAKATTKNQITAQPPPAPSQTADELLAEVVRIEAELEAIPSRIQSAKDLAADSIDDKIITDSLAVVAELEQKATTLRIKHWHARKAYLLAAREEALTPSPKLQDEMVAAREELSQAEKAVKAAIATRDAAKHKLTTLAGRFRGGAILAQEIANQIQRHGEDRPQL
jgi:predicted  nucleic acid-binding Zn-ribbon protein